MPSYALKLVFKETERAPMQEKLFDYIVHEVIQVNLDVPELNKQAFAFTATIPDGRIAACVSGYTEWTELYISMLAANPQERIPGAGTALIQAVEQYAQKLGCDRMLVSTASWQAKPFYEKLGFRVFGVQENLPTGYSKYLLEKRWSLVGKADSASAEEEHSLLNGGSATFTVKPSDPVETNNCLHSWLSYHTLSTVGDRVPPFRRDMYAMEATLEDGTFAAGCVYEVVWNDLHISLFCTNPDLKGRGIGSAFLEKMGEVAKEHGCDRISLETMSWQAKSFYEKNGLYQLGVQDNLPRTYSRYYWEKML